MENPILLNRQLDGNLRVLKIDTQNTLSAVHILKFSWIKKYTTHMHLEIGACVGPFVGSVLPVANTQQGGIIFR
jgi:hypothetical protein